jgi:hypothetical protein
MLHSLAGGSEGVTSQVSYLAMAGNIRLICSFTVLLPV